MGIMKFCPDCGAGFADGVERCATDGNLLVERVAAGRGRNDGGQGSPDDPTIDLSPGEDGEPFSRKTGVLADLSADPLEGTSDIAGQIEDLIFKTCGACHTSSGGA